MIDNGNFIDYVPRVVACAAALAACVSDLRTYRIPNRLTFPLCVSGFLYHGVASGWAGLEFSLLGFLVGLGVLALLFIIGAFGAGDVKLLAGVGAWLGAGATFSVFLVAAVASGLYSLVVLLGRGGVRSVWSTATVLFAQLSIMGQDLAGPESVEELVRRADRRQRLIPFGLMVVIGVAIVAFGGWRIGLGVVT